MKLKERAFEVENLVEEQAGNALNQVQTATRKTFSAYLGMWRMIYDSAVGTANYSKQMFNKVVERGEGVEQSTLEEARDRISEIEAQTSKVQKRIMGTFRRSERELENQMEAALNRLNVPSQETLTALNSKIDMLNRKIDSVMTAQTEVVVEQPLPRYDKLTAKEIVGKLDKLAIEELVQVKQYEMAHENRVTVLRDVDRRLEAMPIARYDALTVDEIEPLLPTLDAADLQAVAEYEKAHENRVTLLRAIEGELDSREKAVA